MKAKGIDEIPAELLKKLEGSAKKELIRIYQDMYEKGEWPRDFTKALIVTMEKKPNATECADHRTLSLIPHASKIMLKVLAKRFEAKTQYFIGPILAEIYTSYFEQENMAKLHDAGVKHWYRYVDATFTLVYRIVA
ncbi:unnamed protein product [Didymodactylos carnosus]|uniref:Uncharacterized protein n=1 Tax=Didymodactylos carnosus TaxID=1234261 RepID=A0A8S2EQW6_9BILA|nr:unnamed protein product [Didymodactylos carnosus]CAF4023232.1 unnamed protein product [Didymodactylos carnosus]